MSRQRKLAIRRELRDDEFLYFRDRTRIRRASEIQRIESVGVPPAWTNVEISSNPSAKVLARGQDAAGRTQAIYHPRYRRKQDRKKFDRIVRFAQSLPRLRAQVDRDLRRRNLTLDLANACVVRLLDNLYLRIGNSEYTRRHGSFGVTTLQKQHVNIEGANVEFTYAGKSGKRQRHRLRDVRVVRVVDQLMQEPGPELFQYLDKHKNLHELKSSDVNRYLREHLGPGFSAKDFRTWGATVIAVRALLRCEAEELRDPREASRAAQSAVREVADVLGNTPAVARSSYIDPRILAAFEQPDVIARVRQKQSRLRNRKYQDRDEQSALALLAILR